MKDPVSQEIRSFILQPNPDVLVLKGKWGVGKTFLWNEILEEMRGDPTITSYRWYSYISLFGIDSLEKFKTSVFEGLEPINNSPVFYKAAFEKVIKSLSSQFQELRFWRWELIKSIAQIRPLDLYRQHREKGKVGLVAAGKLAKVLNSNPFLQNFIGDSWRIGWLAVESAIICVDDLERAGNGLDLKDVFGLITQLKDVKKCKVIVILNESELEKDARAAYSTYREKVVDVEITYNPDVKFALEMTMEGINQDHKKLIAEHIRALEICNIRTLLKIRNCYLKFQDKIEGQIPQIQRDIISALVLFIYIGFSGDLRFPSIENLSEMSDESFINASMTRYLNEQKSHLSPEDVDKNNQAQLVSNLAAIYGWQSINGVDRLVGQFVRNGWIDDDKFDAVTRSQRLEYEDDNTKKSISALKEEIGDDVWMSFENKPADLTNKMKEAIERSSELYPCVGLLSQYVTTLRELGAIDEANDLIAVYFDKNSDKSAQYFDLANSEFRMFGGDIESDLADRLNQQYEKIRRHDLLNSITEQSKADLFASLVNKMKEEILTEEDLELLETFSVTDIKHAIEENVRNRKLELLVRFFMIPSSGYIHSEGYERKYAAIKTTFIRACQLIMLEKPKAEFIFGKWNVLNHLKDLAAEVS